MRDINLQSSVLTLDGLPQETCKVMFLYDDRGWAIRCYDRSGNKLTTLIFSDNQGLADTVGILQPETKKEQEHGDNCRCIKIN